LSGTVDCAIPTIESNAAADLFWHLHIYVTQGDSDTPRGTLLSDYIESTNEWSTSSGARALASAQTISSLAISAGDRIVVELGYAAKNSVTTSYTGTIRYGVETGTNTPMTVDLTAGDTATTTHAPWIEFSGTFTRDDASINLKLTQAGVLATTQGTDTNIKITQAGLDVVAQGDPSNLRITQAGLEIVAQGNPNNIRVTQVGLLVITQAGHDFPALLLFG
jgi:hypothetical protein